MTDNNTDSQVSSHGQKQIRNQRSGNGELNPEKRYKFDTAYYQLLFPEENKAAPPEPPAAVISNHQAASSITSNIQNTNEVQNPQLRESNVTNETKIYQDVMEEEDDD